MVWLTGWERRVKFSVDSGDIDSALVLFPVTLNLGTSVGINSEDISFIFDELGSDANRFKIAVTLADGETQIYADIEYWDDASETAVLHVGPVPDVSSSVDTVLYLYFDSSQSDNTSYIGDSGSVVAQNVWDPYFKLVCHMADATTSTVLDSTSYDNDGTKGAVNEPLEVAGEIGLAQEYEPTDYQIVSVTDDFDSDTIGTITVKLRRTDKDSSFGDLASIVDDAVDTKYVELQITAGDELCLIVRNGGAYEVLRYSDSTWDDELWHLASFVQDGVGPVLVVDGANETHHAHASIPSTDLTAWCDDIGAELDKVCIGRLVRATPSTPFEGILAEVRISSINRSVAWLKATYETLRDHLLDWGLEELEPITDLYLRSDADKGETPPSTNLRLRSDEDKTAITYYKAVSDTLTLSDSISKQITLSAFLETLSISDTIARVGTFYRAFTETLSLSDVIAKLTAKIFSDTLSLSDAFSRVATLYRAFTETITLTDTISKAVATAFSDTLTLADSISKSVSTAFSETLTLADTIAKTVIKTLTDQLTLTDIFGRVATLYRSLTDQITLTDTFSRILTSYRAFTEILTLSDSIQKRVLIAFSDAITLSDTIGKQIGKALTDTLTLADSILKTILKTLTDQITLSDTITRLGTFYRSFTETLSLTESFSVISGFVLHFTETLSISDTIRKSVNKSFADTLSLADTIRKQVSKIFTETLTLSDVIATATSFVRAFSDTLSLSDTISTVTAFIRSFTETLNITDTISKSTSKVIGDILTLTDSVAKRVSIQFSETLNLTDAFATVGSFYRAFTETLTLTDIFGKTATLYRSFTETLSLSDSIRKRVSKSFQDVLSLTDSFSKVVTILLSLTDQITVTDTISKAVSIGLQDALTLIDSISKRVNKQITDTLSLADTIRKQTVKMLTDQITLTEYFSRVIAIKRAFTERLQLIEKVRWWEALSLAVTQIRRILTLDQIRRTLTLTQETREAALDQETRDMSLTRRKGASMSLKALKEED